MRGALRGLQVQVWPSPELLGRRETLQAGWFYVFELIRGLHYIIGPAGELITAVGITLHYTTLHYSTRLPA